MDNLTATIDTTVRRLRIAIVTETYPPEINGVAMTIGQQISGLLARGHSVQLIRPCQGSGDFPRREGALEIIPQPGIAIPFYRGLKFGLPVGQTLARLWRQRTPDLVYIGSSILVALSRLVLGLHYPSDVLAGALLGAALAVFVLQF
jgi:hypothetical protein